MSINSHHPEYDQRINEWRRIDDIINRRNITNYLMELNPQDTSTQNKKRNESYKERAVFYSLASQTLHGFIGTIFSKVPDFEDVPALEYVRKNIDGQGNSIFQQAKSTVSEVVAKSRVGLIATFPIVDRELSRADVEIGGYVASVNQINAENIINWRVASFGAISKLVLVVIKQEINDSDDNYEYKPKESLRELYLENGVYSERIWIREEPRKDKLIIIEERTPKDAKGNTWDFIPFTFVGVENNDHNVDPPNMGALVDLNIAHYRNSADFEDSVWFAGQAQPWMSGLDMDIIEEMRSKGFYVGSRELLPVPEGGQFGFAAAPPNPVVKEAMADKVEMMVSVGARMIKPGGVAKTAEQSSNEKEVQYSILSLITNNVSDAYNFMLNCVLRYNGDDGEPNFKINDEFIEPEATPQELSQIITGYVQGTFPIIDYIRYMKSNKLFDNDKSDEQYIEELSQNG